MAYTVLIIDDDNLMRTCTRDMLEHFGYIVYQAVDGVDGLEKIREFDPDIVLLDVMMPVKDGIETLRELRYGDPPDNRPIIMLTAKSDIATIQTCRKANVNDFVIKPVLFKELNQRIKDVLEKNNKT